MDHLFSVPPPIIVPDGTELSEIVGPRVLSELGLRVNDGVSVALGTLPPSIKSKVHVHPVVWHFTWVLSGKLTVQMKDSLNERPYKITVPPEHGVMTEQGTFFQLINDSKERVQVFYIVGPAFVFEANDSNVAYNDAVVFEEDWDELEKLGWKPPSLPTYHAQQKSRHSSLRRLAGGGLLETVRGEQWNLANGHGTVSVPSVLHRIITSTIPNVEPGDPSEPNNVGDPDPLILELADMFVKFLNKVIGLKTSDDFRNNELHRIVKLKCNTAPSLLAEYELALTLLGLANDYLHPNEVWNVLLFGKHDDLLDESLLSRVRIHVLHQLLDYATTIGGGFQSAGAMENYRAFTGGVYTDPSSYRHYTPH